MNAKTSLIRGADLGCVALVLIIMSVSGGMLWYAGLNYDGLTGSPATKIHPATYFAALLLGVAAFRYGNPVGYAAAVGAARPASLLLFIAGALLLGQAVAIKAPGLAGAVDTFMLPGMLGLLLGGLGSARRQSTLAAIEIAVHGTLAVNAAMGLVEFVVHARLFPYRFEGAIYEYDTRSTALQGHPLGNAAVTAVYVICLMSGGGRLPPWYRSAQIVLQLGALVAFGGRSALAIVAVIGVPLLVSAARRTLRRGRIPLLGAVVAAFALVLIPVVLIGLSANGSFDAIQTRFTSDSASNGARLAMFNLFAPFSLSELLFGPDLLRVEAARRVAGLELGLENPLVRFALYNGLLMTMLLAVSVILFLAEISKVSRPPLLAPMMTITVLLNSFESLANKNTLLAKLAIILLALYRRDDVE